MDAQLPRRTPLAHEIPQQSGFPDKDETVLRPLPPRRPHAQMDEGGRAGSEATV